MVGCANNFFIISCAIMILTNFDEETNNNTSSQSDRKSQTSQKYLKKLSANVNLSSFCQLWSVQKKTMRISISTNALLSACLLSVKLLDSKHSPIVLWFQEINFLSSIKASRLQLVTEFIRGKSKKFFRKKCLATRMNIIRCWTIIMIPNSTRTLVKASKLPNPQNQEDWLIELKIRRTSFTLAEFQLVISSTSFYFLSCYFRNRYIKYHSLFWLLL